MTDGNCLNEHNLFVAAVLAQQICHVLEGLAH